MLMLSSPITARGTLRQKTLSGLTGALWADCIPSLPEPSSRREVDAGVGARTNAARRRCERFMQENATEPRSRDGARAD
jgi:hypothetical protein